MITLELMERSSSLAPRPDLDDKQPPEKLAISHDGFERVEPH